MRSALQLVESNTDRSPSSRNSTLHRKNESSTPHATRPHRNSCLPSTACPQFQESIDEGCRNGENAPLTSGDKRARWDSKAAEADDAGGGLQGDNNEQSTLLRPTKKRCQSVGGKKLPVKRRVKRRRFSSPLSSDEEIETGTQPDISSYPPAKTYRTFNLRSSSSPLPVGREREPKPDDALEGANGKSRRRPLSRTAVVYKQQCWEGEILQERDVKQERGRPRKQYLVRWEQSWVDGASLAAPELLRDWREKKVSSKRKC